MRRLLTATALLLMSATAWAQNCEYPGVLVILDRSVSMQGTIDGTTKWDIAQDAVAGMLMEHGDVAHFGLMLYPGPSGTNPLGIDTQNDCLTNGSEAGCAPETPRCTPGEVVVDIGANTRDPIMDAMVWPAVISHGYTPTWQSLEAASQYGPLRTPTRRNFVVLVTDGWQCCDYRDGGTCGAAATAPLFEKVQALRDAGVTVYVMGFGGSVDVRSLQRMATTAGTDRPGCNPDQMDAAARDLCYYQANNHAELSGLLDDIVWEISEEICDGLDNDCDGTVDGMEQACQSACGPGTSACVNGQWMACSADDTRPEECNGLDDDCDGQADEDLRRACSTACGQGQERCVNGGWSTCDAPTPSAEICDGVDNNCDSNIDEGCDCAAGDTRPCGNDVGYCRSGQQTCGADGTWSDCEGGRGPQPEVCDGEDNDCDGQTDGMEEACTSTCGSGARRCVGGAWSECDAPAGSPEACNGQDDDCDGQIDEGLSRACQSECGAGQEICSSGIWSECDARRPVGEICNNGFDDNCDGQTDEGCECQDGQTQPCGQALGVCDQGLQTCVDAHWGACVGGIGPSQEICDGLDNDCDGQIDNGDLCAEGQLCVCGGCANPCIANECPDGVQCVYGVCPEDHCPDGQYCLDGQCRPGEGRLDAGGTGGPGTLNYDSGWDTDAGGNGALSDDGCHCRVGGGGADWTALALLALLALPLRRRRAR
ncbi:hypothetical protein KKF91_13210 [Myxococcota bacterium]|nr:hypothetical protein [Myxococcota bacterium]MBU1431495.1 hypothetical protein [Myxococcota bacterium]MBU1900615.1 hypothetical protein [Myxococcota bacterium]